MTARGRGRPPSGGKTVLPERILSEALSIVDTDGLDGLTMRALAARVGINPMTIYYHFKDRDGLIKALAEWVYADVTAPELGDALKRVHGLLTAYYAKVARYPTLTLAIFAQPTLFPDHAKRITADLIGLLSERDHATQHTLRWTNILVDYTHGAALAAATQEGRAGHLPIAAMPDDFESGLGALMEAFSRSSDRPGV